jgi:HAD superfamily hydrolase (TIGR01509 family)
MQGAGMTESVTSLAPRAVVFDLDGLMFNTEELYQAVGTELLRRRRCEFTAELLDRMMGRPGKVALQIMIDHHGLDATVDQLEQETDEIFPPILDARLALMPGLADLLEALEQAGIPKGIATSSRRSFVTNVLGRFQLEPRFQFVLTAEDVTHGKPDPEIYLKAAAKFGLPPTQVAVLEDSENGCRAAVRSGAVAVAVPGGHSLRHDFAGARLVIDTLADRRLYALLGLS